MSLKKKFFKPAVAAVFVLSFVVCTLLSFGLHTRMLMQTVARTSQAACGQAAQTTIHGLSYGKEIANYSGIDGLLEGVIRLYPELKNVYICDTEGVIWGSYIKMMDNTGLVDKRLMSDNGNKLNIRLQGIELHMLQALLMEGRTVGFIGAVTDLKTVMQPFYGELPGEIGQMLLFQVIVTAGCLLVLARTKSSLRCTCAVVAIACMLSACVLHLNTQRTLLDIELERQSQVVVATINADAAKLTEKGIDIGSIIGFDRYLAEKLEGQDTISVIMLENKQNGQHYTADTAQGMTTAYTKGYSDLPHFNISIGISQQTYDRYSQYSFAVWAVTLVLLELLIMATMYRSKRPKSA